MMISTSVRLLDLTCSLVAGRGAFGQTVGSIDGEARDVTGAAVVGITVSALLVTDNATVGTVIENERIVELPLSGRNYLQLVSLEPNVSTGFSSQGQAVSGQEGIRACETTAVGGQRTNFNHYTLDEVENTDPNSRLQRGEKCA